MVEYLIGLSWGTLVGFAIAIPVGPVGLVCIQRTISRNRKSGLVSGFGAAVADVLLASVGAFSITAIFSFITDHKSLLEVFGGFLLFFLGLLKLSMHTHKFTRVRCSMVLCLGVGTWTVKH